MPVLGVLGRLARWVAPSAVAACTGAVVAGSFEGVGMASFVGIAATAGFFAIVALPVLFVGSLIVRGLLLAWRPRELATAIVQADGSAPRLAGWVATLWLGTLAFAWAIYEGTKLLAERDPHFRPTVVSFALPAIAFAAALAVFAAARPGARLFTDLAHRLDARWRQGKPGRPTLLRPRTIFVGAGVTATIAAYVIWLVVIAPRLEAFDGRLFHGPAIALAVTGAMHVAWSRLPRRKVSGTGIVVLGLATVGSAFAVRHTRPSLTLEIWGDRPLAGLAIDQLFSLDAIRGDISLVEFRPIEVPGAPHPDIILITIDTVRADRTPPYGGPAVMPVLRGLGERGAVFSWAFAPSNVTRRSIPALAIGLAPNRVRGRVVGWALRVDPRHVLLAERLRAGGYATAGFMCCPGFWGEEIRTGLQRGLEHLDIEPNGTKLARLASAWLEKRDDKRPLFVWMHILEPHNWTVGVGSPRNDDERKRFYDRSLAQSDTIVAELLRPLATRSPIIIVTADHGEALGEHGHDYHSTDLYNSQMRVPLVIAGPGIVKQRVPETVSLVDLVPTIVELAGFQAPTYVDGRSLADVLRGQRTSQPETGTAFAAMIKDRSNPGGITSFVKGRWKIIDNDDGIDELYDIYNDPDERVNLANQRPEILRELRALLEAKLAAGRESPFQ